MISVALFSEICACPGGFLTLKECPPVLAIFFTEVSPETRITILIETNLF